MDNPQVNTNSNQGTSTSVRTTSSSPIQSAALDFLLSDSAVSSLQETNSSIINRAQQNFETTKQGAEATRDFQRGRIQMETDRDMDTLLTNANMTNLSMQESRGLATSMAQFQVFEQSVQKQVNWLNIAKEDALRAADMNYYAQIQNAEMNLINTQLKATESMMNQMFGIAGITQSQQQMQLAQEAQAFQQEQAVGSIALEFGLQAIPGESLSDVITRAMPSASADRKLKLQQMQASINKENAQIAQIRADMARADRREQALKSITPEMATTMYLQDPAQYSSLIAMAADSGDYNALQNIVQGRADAEYQSIRTNLGRLKDSGISKKDAMSNLLAAYPSLNSGAHQAEIMRAVEELYGADKEKKGIFGGLFNQPVGEYGGADAWSKTYTNTRK